VAEHAFSDLVAPAAAGRIFSQEVRPGFADSAPSGRIRLDAVARWLQDVAYCDVADVGLAEVAVWVVRRARIAVGEFPRFGERYSLSTYCSGLGRMWAERRTNVTRVGDSLPCVEAVSLWVHLDPVSWRPTPVSAAELAVYADSANGRRVTARLRHPGPGSARSADGAGGAGGAGDAGEAGEVGEVGPTDGAATSLHWTFRATDCDLAGHVNNAAYWLPLEEELLRGTEPDRLDAEIEYRTAAQPGDVVVVGIGSRRWILDAEGETLASIVVAPR
jgi:acyl-ACP thioesterase